MTLQQLLFDEAIEQTPLVEDCGSNDLTFAKFGGLAVDAKAISSKRGALCGGTLNPIKRIGDVKNKISLASAGVYISKGAFKEDNPYYREYQNGILVALPSYHFLTELRRQLSGEVLPEDSMFSPEEVIFYTEYAEWTEGISKEGELLIALEALDQWIEDELMGIVHPILNRDYESTHKWSKLDEREE